MKTFNQESRQTGLDSNRVLPEISPALRLQKATASSVCIRTLTNITLYFAGQNCSTFLDLLVRLINLIFGRQGASWCPRESPPGGIPPPAGGNPPSGGGAQPEGDLGGEPKGGDNVPPEDAEEIDPTQNDAVRDWE